MEKPEMGFSEAGISEFALGPADGQVVSLGDGGHIILSFSAPLKNGPGPDLAVFENGFSDFFLELAQVSVSSNGIDFFQFPNFSETDTLDQIGPFDSLKAENLSGLAGKYAAGWGTPFDLEDLKNEPGLDINKINYVKIQDVIGTLNPAHCTRDSRGRPINDPYPTPFPSGGFDLDAVGVLHLVQAKGNEVFLENAAIVNGEYVGFQTGNGGYLLVTDVNGRRLEEKTFPKGRTQLDCRFSKGLYLLRFQIENHTQTFKLIVL